MKEEMKAVLKREAERRLKLLGLEPKNDVWVSCLVISVPLSGLGEEHEKEVHALEDRCGIYVYQGVLYRAPYGQCLDCLYVSLPDAIQDKIAETGEMPEFDEEHNAQWEEERHWIKADGVCNIYAFNHTTPEFSEFGSGQYEKQYGHLHKLR